VNQEFSRLTVEDAKQIALEIPARPFDAIKLAIDTTYRDVVRALPSPRRILIENRIAAGVLDHGYANAFIARSPDGKFAILFSFGLAIFLHKCIKLIAALEKPKCVTYCSRKSAQALTENDIQNYLDEMIAYYARHSVPRGPLIKVTSQEAARVGSIVKSAEAFIICHELGHFLNGDLDDETRYSAMPLGALGDRYEENQDHELEYKADKVGYELYLRFIAATGWDVTPQASLALVMAVFDLFYKLAEGASSSHPHPHDRIVRIVRDRFSPDLATRVAEGLRDPRLLQEVFPMPTSRSTER
jgi:hypothetical protein